jgi:predicted ATPase
MITKWKLGNFKSVQNETALDFAPLTIFAGTNSSGKSTLLQSILLISQTLLDKDPTRQVVLNGQYIQLGEFSDIKSTDGISDQIIIGWELKSPKGNISDDRFDVEQISLISCEIAFGMDDSKSRPTLSSVALAVQKQITNDNTYKCSLQAIRATEETKEYKKKLLYNPYSEEVVSTLDYDVRLERASCQSCGDSGNINDREILYSSELFGNWITNFSYDHKSNHGDDYQFSYGQIHEKEVLYRSKTIGCSFWHFLPDLITSLVETEVERIEAIRNVFCLYKGVCPFDFLSETPTFLPLKIRSCIQEIVRDMDQNDYDTYEKIVTKDCESPDAKGEPIIPASLDDLVDELLELLDDESKNFDDFFDFLTEGDFTSSFCFREVVVIKLNKSQKFQALLDEMIQWIKRNGEVRQELVRCHISEDAGTLKSFYTNFVRYIGPLRIDPEPSYPISSTSFLEDVGLEGENTAAVFESQKMREIQYIPASDFNTSANIPVPVKSSLQDAVVDWLGYLGVADKIESKDSAQFGHQLHVCMSQRNKSHDMTQVGVGVSQVLPIIVAGLLAEADTTLIIEQPELHLHPKVQSRLADFFLSLTLLGKQCLVETHSEHIINRIRLRIAEGSKSSPWQEATKVYFVEKKESCSSFREVSINEYGAIQDWPKGFFEEGLLENEKRIRAMALKQHVKGRYN